MRKQWLVGIDEVGRGPLAGPVAVGVVLVQDDFRWEQIPGINDSKALSAHKREALYKKAQKMRRHGRLDFTVTQISPAIIDGRGITYAIQLALGRSLSRLLRRNEIEDCNSVTIKLDGGLRASKLYCKQETIIKGDSKEPAIGLASIVAKVTRDKYMYRVGSKIEYASYGFAAHKGYGTKKHRECIAKYGMTSEHRKSYCRNIKIKV